MDLRDSLRICAPTVSLPRPERCGMRRAWVGGAGKGTRSVTRVPTEGAGWGALGGLSETAAAKGRLEAQRDPRGGRGARARNRQRFRSSPGRPGLRRPQHPGSRSASPAEGVAADAGAGGRGPRSDPGHYKSGELGGEADERAATRRATSASVANTSPWASIGGRHATDRIRGAGPSSRASATRAPPAEAHRRAFVAASNRSMRVGIMNRSPTACRNRT